MSLRLDAVTENLAYFGQGILTTIELTLIAGPIAIAIGTVLAAMRLSRFKLVSLPATAYIELIRAIPLLLVIYWVYFLGPKFGYRFPTFNSVVVALVAFESAYFAEIMRSGIRSIGKGQVEAAMAGGLSYLQTMRYVVVPQAFRRMVPALISQLIALLKDTSLAYIVGLSEFFNRITIVNNRELTAPYELFIFAALVYFVLCYALSLASRYSERRMVLQL